MMTKKRINEKIVNTLKSSFEEMFFSHVDFMDKHEIHIELFSGIKVTIPKKYKLSFFNINRHNKDYKLVIKLYKLYFNFQGFGLNKSEKKFGIFRCYDEFKHDELEFNFDDLISFDAKSYDLSSTYGIVPGMNNGQYLNALVVADSINRFGYGQITLTLNNYEPICYSLVIRDEILYQKLVSYFQYILANK